MRPPNKNDKILLFFSLWEIWNSQNNILYLMVNLLMLKVMLLHDIFRAHENAPIIVQHMPEFTPICNEAMFVYRKVKFRKKYPK